jgi:hypothetical protein
MLKWHERSLLHLFIKYAISEVYLYKRHNPTVHVLVVIIDFSYITRIFHGSKPGMQDVVIWVQYAMPVSV